ncbi:hypothetical protein ES703_86997 [subsurface metagenome]
MTQEKIRVVVNLTKAHLDGIDHLAEQGQYMNRQAFIRDAVRHLLRTWGALTFKPEAEG